MTGTETPTTQTPGPDRGARRRERTRRQLLDAARVVIGERGIDAATIQQITEAADVAFGSFYNHFESKDAVVDELLAQAIADHARFVDEVSAPLSDPAEMLANAVYQTVRMATRDPLWGWFVVRLTGGRAELGAPMVGHLARDLEAGVKAGLFPGANVPVLVLAIAGSAIGVMYGRLTGVLDEADEWDYTESMLRLAGMTEGDAHSTVARLRKALQTNAPAKPR